MSEMVERVAAALHRCDEPGELADANEAQKRYCYAGARAAIEAMREPTEKMIYPALTDEERLEAKAQDAGETNWGPCDNTYFQFHRQDDAAGIWRAMVAVALDEPPPGERHDSI